MQVQFKTQSLPNKPNWKVWWELTRPHTLTASFVPVILGTVLAFLEGEYKLLLFIAMLAATLFIQIATNLFNEYYDFIRGLDTPESVGIGGGIVRHGMNPKFILNLALGLYGLSILLGVYICNESSWWLAVVGLICMAVGYLYTGGPFPISYTPFGEILSGLFFGFLVIQISFFIQAGYISNKAILVAVPTGILVALINLANNIRDHDGDKPKGRKTIPVVLGRKKAIKVMGVMFGISYLWLIGLVITGIVTYWSLIALISLPKAIEATRGFIGKTKPITMMPAMKATGQTNTFFGFLLSFGLLLGYFL